VAVTPSYQKQPHMLTIAFGRCGDLRENGTPKLVRRNFHRRSNYLYAYKAGDLEPWRLAGKGREWRCIRVLPGV